MLFSSSGFLLFFVAVLIGTAALHRHQAAKKMFLLAASYYFYMTLDWRFSLLLIVLTAINFWAGNALAAADNPQRKKAFLALAIVTSLGILGYFKYANFFLENINLLLSALGFARDIPLVHVLLPVGISFITFQAITYPLDIYRGRMHATNSLTDFALFIAFFPKLLSGPITRASFFLPQLQEPSRPADLPISGLALMVQGFVKKIVFADVLAVHIVNPAFGDPFAYSPLFLAVAIYAYSFQIYMDLSGYTDIARGAARMLGYELPINFDRPYIATSISNFWQRWHISMSSFFRDYLYFGVGGSKHGNVYVNLMITFVAIGAWHGAGWNFIVYGLFHGGFVCWERYQRNRRKALGLPPVEYAGLRWVLRVAYIFTLASVLRILFRGGTLDTALEYLQAMTVWSQTYTPLSAVGLAALLGAMVLHFNPGTLGRTAASAGLWSAWLDMGAGRGGDSAGAGGVCGG